MAKLLHFSRRGLCWFLHGHVVDMLQFPLVSWTWPEWLPFVGGQYYTFFECVFNVADAAISSGVAILLFFNRKFYLVKEYTLIGVTQ